MRPSLSILTRLAACAAAVAAIAGAFVQFYPGGRTPEARADIVDFLPRSLTAEHDFARLMNDTGMRPRAYDMNGNTVYFAVGSTDMRPPEVQRFYQHKLVEAGINRKAWIEPPAASAPHAPDALPHGAMRQSRELSEGMLLGEVVPFSAGPGYMAMGGIVTHGRHGSLEEFFRTWQPNARGALDFDERIKAFRFIDATFDAPQQRSLVTATWSDHKFDARKMHDPDAAGVPQDPQLPVCANCKRRLRLESLEPGEDFVTNQYATTQPPALAYQHYRNTMLSQGWNNSETQVMLDRLQPFVPFLGELDGMILNLERDGRHITLVFTPQEGGQTFITAVEGT